VFVVGGSGGIVNSKLDSLLSLSFSLSIVSRIKVMAEREGGTIL
jgi:hypothetical protein